MNILIINPGSSTVKFKYYTAGKEVFAAMLDKHEVGDRVFAKPVSYIKSLLKHEFDENTRHPDAIGVRVVHGGEIFLKTTLMTRANLKKLAWLRDLAPLHNPIAENIIKESFEVYPGVPVAGCFDTQFHRTMPDEAKNYAIPYRLAKKYGIRKYGFHGLAHQYMYEEACRQLKKKKLARVITCQLGSGASICAVKDGQSVDTTMGMTPLDGLVMTTRCGDIDPEVIFYLMDQGFSAAEVKDILEKQSGLLGLYGKSSDMRDVIKHKAEDPRAKLAFDIFVYRVVEYISAYIGILGGVDAICFGGGMGHRSSIVRKSVCERLKCFGALVDSNLNFKNELGVFSSGKSKIKLLITHVDEGLMMRKKVEKLLG